MDLLQSSWERAWAALALPAPAGLREQLLQRHEEPHRHYHTLEHLRECAQWLSRVVEQAEHPGELELALWFHDAVYDVTRQDNESQSARWARQALAQSGVPSTTAARVHDLVLVTRHHDEPVGVDARLVADIDLAILGARPSRFDAYERQIQQEYAWMPHGLFRHKRAAMLGRLLARSSIYRTRFFQSRLEAQARRNLMRSIERLNADPKT